MPSASWVWLLMLPEGAKAPWRRGWGQITGSQSYSMMGFSSAARRWLGAAILSANWLTVQEFNEPRCPTGHPSPPVHPSFHPGPLASGGIQAATFCLFSPVPHSVPSPRETQCILFLVLRQPGIGFPNCRRCVYPLLLVGHRAVHATPEAT